MRGSAKLRRIFYLALCCYVASKILHDFRLILWPEKRRHGRSGPIRITGLSGVHGANSTSRYLLALFTTLARGDGNDNITRTMLANWANISSQIQPYLFYLPGQDDVISMAVSRGWRTLPVPKKNKYSVPYLKAMYEVMAESCSSLFFGYSNGDILFDSGLTKTLNAVKQNLDVLDPVLVIGRRTTIDESGLKLVQGGFVDVSRLAGSGLLDRADAEDYFLVTRRFPWRLFPDLVIGRKAYDNFLVARSIDSNVSVIDATNTITSVHLRRSKRLGVRTKGDILFNKYKLINKFDYMKAMTLSAPYYTSVVGNQVTINKRKYDARFKNVNWN